MTDLPSFGLTDQIALVTGAARGLGRAIALALRPAWPSPRSASLLLRMA